MAVPPTEYVKVVGDVGGVDNVTANVPLLEPVQAEPISVAAAAHNGHLARRWGPPR